MKFDKNQLERWIDQELSLLRYYGYREDRARLNNNSNLYEDIRSIGYTKRPMSLRNRCVPTLIKSDSEISPNTKIEDLYISYDRINTYSPCEVFMKMFPNRRDEVIQILQNQKSNPTTTIYI